MKKTLAIMLALIMVLALVPSVAFAADEVAWINGKGYETLEAAVNAAKSGETITLGKGEYTLYEKNANVLNKDLTFVGQGADKTTYHIGAKDTSHSDGPCDYSLDGRGTDMKETVTFKDMTIDAGKYPEVQTKDAYLHGLAGIDNIVLDNCTFNGIASYWGYVTTKFNNVIFNAPGTEASEIEGVDYSLWTWTGTEYTFNNCTFNSAGKVINVYHGDGERATTINFNNCTVNSTNPESLSVMNINDALVKSFTINFNGKNTINDIKADGIQVTGGSHASAASNTNPPLKKTSEQATCSKLFEFNMKYGNGNNKRTTVNIDGKTVWQNGKMLGHAIVTENDKYTDGYKDNAFTVTPKPNVPGSFDVTCDYCGYTETSTGGLYNDIELERTVKQNSKSVSEDTPNSNKYKVANSNNITVDYTATMNMEKLRWLVAGKDVEEIQKELDLDETEVKSPWELLKYLALTEQIDDGRTEVILTFKFDDKINLGEFEKKYNEATTTADKEKLLKLTSDMFKMTGVAFGPDNTMTITCKWNLSAITTDAPAPKITLKGCGLPVEANWGESKQINIENSGCVSGTVHIKYENSGPEEAAARAETVVPNVAADVQVPSTNPPVITTIQIPIVGGCKTDEFTLYYGGGSSGGGYYNPTTTPVPVIVIPPKTGDMTIWQSILHFLGIR